MPRQPGTTVERDSGSVGLSPSTAAALTDGSSDRPTALGAELVPRRRSRSPADAKLALHAGVDRADVSDAGRRDIHVEDRDLTGVHRDSVLVVDGQVVGSSPVVADDECDRARRRELGTARGEPIVHRCDGDGRAIWSPTRVCCELCCRMAAASVPKSVTAASAPSQRCDDD